MTLDCTRCQRGRFEVVTDYIFHCPDCGFYLVLEKLDSRSMPERPKTMEELEEEKGQRS